MHLKDIIFERSLSILLFENSYAFCEKNVFPLLVTPILTVSSPFFSITKATDFYHLSIKTTEAGGGGAEFAPPLPMTTKLKNTP